ncbi:MAG: hypothetical protein HQL31_09700, partial [Planctomycetes bacterium]|nr:hypothetical protein [Planctomycetota bacterium]
LVFLFFDSSVLLANIRFQGSAFVNRKTGPLEFDANNDGVGDVSMTSEGYMGIATLSPGANLHIAGNLQVGGNIHLGTSVQPSSPAAGDVYSSGTAPYYYNGSSWKDLSLAGEDVWTSASGNL